MDEKEKVVQLNMDDVLPNRFQPRIKFNEDSINELSSSIKEHGVIQPIVVRRIGDKYEIIAGERRFKASQVAGLKQIPAIIKELDDKDSAEVALIENIQRQNLTPIEEAVSYKRILDKEYLTQEGLAEKLGKNQSTIANKLRLLNLSEEVQEALLEGKISERHARSLLRIKDYHDQVNMLNKIINERLTVRKADEEIDKLLNGTPEENLNNDFEIIDFDDIKAEPIKTSVINAPASPIIDDYEVLDEIEDKDKNVPNKFINFEDDYFIQPQKETLNFNDLYDTSSDSSFKTDNFISNESNNIKQAKDVIKDCKEKLESLGFKVSFNEYDLSSMYQATITIDK